MQGPREDGVEGFRHDADLLQQNPRPTQSEIVEHMSVHICRCGTYQRVLRAIERAAREA